MISVLFLLKHCKDRGKYDLALKIIDKYNIDKPLVVIAFL